MSIFSAFLKRSVGLPELHLTRGLKNVANEALNSYKAPVLEAIDKTAGEIRRSVGPLTTDAMIRGFLHDAIEHLHQPAHVRMLVGVLIDTLSLGDAREAGTEAALNVLDAEVSRIKRQIIGARF